MPTSKLEQIRSKRRPRPQQTVLGSPSLWLFDMDDTLYNASQDMFAQIHLRMEGFIAGRLGIDTESAAAIQRGYWAKYGATFLGLEKHHGIDPVEFLAASHDFEVADFVGARHPGAAIRRVIASLPGKKAVLTNGPGEYARAVLHALGLSDLFCEVFTSSDMRLMGRWRCKPDTGLLEAVCAKCRTRPGNAVLVEDSPANLKSARSLGMKTVFCTGYRERTKPHIIPPGFVDLTIGNIIELGKYASHRTK